MSAKTVVAAFTGFLTHHVADLTAVGTALNSILDAIPVNAQTRDHIKDVISQVENSAVNVTAFLEGTPTLSGGEVVVKQSDLTAAVTAYLKANPVKPVDPVAPTDAQVSAAVAAYFKANPPK